MIKKIKTNNDEELYNRALEVYYKFQKYELPPYQMQVLGLQLGWQKKISLDFIVKVIKAAEECKGVLRKLAEL
jgi:hypothetical protein